MRGDQLSLLSNVTPKQDDLDTQFIRIDLGSDKIVVF